MLPHWQYNNQDFIEIPEGIIGFVYLITSLTSGVKYIGKKNAYFKKTRAPLKGKKRRRREVVNSDWVEYVGSSPAFSAIIECEGRNNFKREILHLCKSKGEMSYLETHEIFIRGALLKPTEYANEWVSVRVRRAHLKNLVIATSPLV